jgi:hypothetical protein
MPSDQYQDSFTFIDTPILIIEVIELLVLLIIR